MSVRYFDAAAAGGKPVITKGGGTETFADDFILDLCGIETETTLTEKWTLRLHGRKGFESRTVRAPTPRAWPTRRWDCSSPVCATLRRVGNSFAADGG